MPYSTALIEISKTQPDTSGNEILEPLGEK